MMPLLDPFDSHELMPHPPRLVTLRCRCQGTSTPNALIPAMYPSALPTQAPQCLNFICARESMSYTSKSMNKCPIYKRCKVSSNGGFGS
ncbi:hypothetical protein DsansV1_C07g0070301 [Dioscorea sansibarensis]